MAGNQHIPDPRQALFLENYLNPDSDTFSDAKNSAIAAGYSREYAENITSLMPNWLSDKVEDLYLASETQNNIRKALTYDHGELVKMFGKNPKWEATVLTAKGLLKSKYSERTEVTGKDGGAIEYNNINELSDDELINLSRASTS